MILRTIIELQLDIRDDVTDQMKEGIVEDITNTIPMVFFLQGCDEDDYIEDSCATVINSCVSFLPKGSTMDATKLDPFASIKVTKEKIEENASLNAALSGNCNDLI